MTKTPIPDYGSYLKQKGSPYADHVDQLLAAANRWRVDPRLLISISGGETSFGKTGSGPSSFNAWGIGPGRRYASWADGFNQAAKLLRTGYLDKGLTSLAAIQRKWAPIAAANDPTNLNSAWLRNNSQFYSELGGNPMNVTAGWRAGASPTTRAAATPEQTVTPPAADPFKAQALQNLTDIAAGAKPTTTLMPLVWARAMSNRLAEQRKETKTPTRSPTSVPKGKTGVPVVDLTSIGGQHATSGLAGYPAKDYFAPSGSLVVAPISGKVIKVSGHDPAQGPTQGPHGPLGWSVYIQGDDGHTYYLTHMGSRSVAVGDMVLASQPIGSVADYARYGTPSHVHMGVH